MKSAKSDGKYSESHLITLTRKTWYESSREYLNCLYDQLGFFVAFSLSTWALAEVVQQAVGSRVSISEIALPILLAALIISFYRAFRKMVTYVPKFLHSESPSLQDIYRRQSSGWNFSLAKLKLSEQIAEADEILSRIKEGSEFVG